MTEQQAERDLDQISLKLIPGSWTTEAHFEIAFATDINKGIEPVPVVMVIPNAGPADSAEETARRSMRHRFLRLAGICNQRALLPIEGLEIERWSDSLKREQLALEFVAKPRGSSDREKTTAHFQVSLATDTDSVQQTVTLVMEVPHPANAPHPREIDALMWTHMRDRFLRLADMCDEGTHQEVAPEDKPPAEGIGLLAHDRI